MNVKKDLLEYERQHWTAGKQVLGVDEAGYGCFAGSMFVAGVCFDPMTSIPRELSKVKDSKKLSELDRFALEPHIKKMCRFWFCVEVTPDEINASSNVYWMRFQAAEDRIREEYSEWVTGNVVVYDGDKSLRLTDLDCENESLVKGDGKSFSIAAASIIAKTAKDREMIQKDQMYPEYEFAYNKGYYSENHANALRKHGMCPEHRHKYCRKYV